LRERESQVPNLFPVGSMYFSCLALLVAFIFLHSFAVSPTSPSPPTATTHPPHQPATPLAVVFSQQRVGGGWRQSLRIFGTPARPRHLNEAGGGTDIVTPRVM
jgi:hypothetical protein